MTIIYPVDQRLLSGKAHDILIVRTCHALASLGHTVFLVMQAVDLDLSTFLSHYGIQASPHLHVISIPVRQKNLGIAWRFLYRRLCFQKIRELLRAFPIDLIYLSELKLAHYLLRRSSILRKPIIYEYHNLKAFDMEPFQPDRMEGMVYKESTSVIATTRELIGMLRRFYGDRKNMVTISLASHLFSEPFFPRPIEKETEARIFYLGQHYPLQGVDLLIEAMASLSRGELHTVGGRPEEIEDLKEIARQNGMISRVHFHGFVRPPEIPSLLRNADVLVVPSRNAGRMPYVAHTKIYEYMAYGKPIVAADLPSIREVLVDHHNSVLVSPDDAKALAAGIEEILSDPALAEKIARNAHETARHHTWEARGNALINHFKTASAGLSKTKEGVE